MTTPIALTLSLVGLLWPAGVAQDEATSEAPQKEEDVFVLDLPEWSPDPQDVPAELRPLDVERPTLPEELARESAELKARVVELQTRALAAATREEQDAALDEAIGLNERLLEIHRPYQENTKEVVRWRGPDGTPRTWHELTTLEVTLDHLHLLKGMDDDTRSELAAVENAVSEVTRLYGRGRYSEARALAERNLAVRGRVYGEEHPLTLDSINNVGVIHLGQDNLDQAESYCQRALEGRRRTLGDEHPDTLHSIYSLANVILDRGRVSEAGRHFLEALAGQRRTLGDGDPMTLQSINSLGVVRGTEGHLSDAEPYLQIALKHLRGAVGDDNTRTLTAVGNLGSLFMRQGRLAEAEPYSRAALEACRRVLGDDHPQTLAAIDRLGSLLEDQGRLAEAGAHFREALEGRRRVLGDDHWDTLASTNNLGLLLFNEGRFSEAELYLREAVEGCRRVRGDRHANTLTAINNLGLLLLNDLRFAEAEPYLREALTKRRERLGDEHPRTLTSLNNLGLLLMEDGRLVEAEAYLREAFEAKLRTLGEDHPGTQIPRSNLGGLLRDLGRLDEAEPYLAGAVEGFRAALGDEHPSSMNTMYRLGALYEAQGRLPEAMQLYRDALSVAERLRRDASGGAQERAQFAGKLEIPGIAARYARALAASGRTSEALSALERGRSRAALDLMAGGSVEAERLLRASGDARALARYDAALAEERRAKRAEFEAEARMAKAPQEEKSAWRERLKEARVTLSEKTARVYEELRGLVPAGAPATSEEVLASLEAGEGLLSYSWTSDGVIALVVRDGQVHSVPLAKNGSEVAKRREALTSLRARIAWEPSAGKNVPPGVLSAAREAAAPRKLQELLDGVSALTVIADGPLVGIPLETVLPGTPIVYAPSATAVVRARQVTEERTPRLASAVVLGDPVFARSLRGDLEYPETGVLLQVVREGSMAEQAGLRRGDVLLSYGEHDLFAPPDLGTAIGATSGSGGVSVPAFVWRHGEELEVQLAPGSMGVVISEVSPADGLRKMSALDRAASSSSRRGTTLEQVRLYGGTLKRLPATRVEAEAVAALFADDATLLLGNEASAPRLREAIESSRPRVLHLATHGLMGTADRPLQASLALTMPEAPTPEDIGFLTLEEILGTWGAQLHGSELVTLSACDTGRGVRQGDTVMALPLGLFVAGAETVLASLWEVDDRATALLMARFYVNWLGRTTSAREVDGDRYAAGEPLPKLAALREAQLWLRSLTAADRDRLKTADAAAIVQEAGRESAGSASGAAREAAAGAHPYEHPYYWAGFVLFGNAR